MRYQLANVSERPATIDLARRQANDELARLRFMVSNLMFSQRPGSIAKARRRSAGLKGVELNPTFLASFFALRFLQTVKLRAALYGEFDALLEAVSGGHGGDWNPR